MNYNDRRAKRTKKMIRKSFFELLLEKNISEISIKELSERADINRGTFYSHYDDIYDLLSEIEKETLEEIKIILDSHTTDELKKNILSLIEDIISYVYKNQTLFNAFFECNRDINFTEQISEIFKNKCFYDWDSIFKSENKKNYELYFAYIESGCIGLIRYWLNTDNKNVEEISRIACSLIFSGVDIIK